MKSEFDYFLYNNMPDYEKPFLNEQKYIILIKDNNGKISYALGNVCINFLASPPNIGKSYSSPIMFLEDELRLCDSNQGIIYENIDGKGDFQSIAYINTLDD